MSWSVGLDPKALQQFRRLERGPFLEAGGMLEDLADGPDTVPSKELDHYPGVFSARFYSDYRMIFTVNKRRKLIRVIRIEHRETSYRGMKRPNP